MNPGHPAPDLYLPLASAIVRQATCWQTPEGVIGDPHNAPGVESVTATARYCAAIGHLLAAGWCTDLLPHAVAALDWCCGELARHYQAGEQWAGAQFNVKDMMVLYGALAEGRVGQAASLSGDGAGEDARCTRIPAGEDARSTRERWTAQLTFDPERLYYGERNFLYYSTAAETLRIHYGLTSGWEYVDRLLDSQMEFWTPEGMYRDPHDPVTYDLTVRQALAMMLHYGYAGRHVEWMRDVLRRGALTTLRFISPCGVAPYGGRSNQFHIQEGMIAYFAEWQAQQEAAAGNLALAGELRRMALAGAEAVGRWVLQDSYASLKHHMGEHEMFGQDGYHPGQNARSGYGLLGANLFAGAYHVADDTIAVAPPPTLEGGQMLHLADAFHRVFATVGDFHLQIDTRGQAGYDATGLGRLHRRGVPIEAALNMSIVSAPSYRLPPPTAPRSVALGVGWPHADGWRYLSEADRETHSVTVTKHREGDPVEFTVTYGFPDPDAWGVAEVVEHYSLSSAGLRCRVEVPGASRLRLQVPVIETDGRDQSKVTPGRERLEVRYMGHTYVVCVEGSVAQSFFEPWPAPNRNGIYRVAVFEVGGNSVGYEASLA